jgi:Flp pilus assembly pilin Flp
MKAGSFIDLLAAIVTVALVTTIVTNKNSATIISAVANGFSGALKAAQGK